MLNGAEGAVGFCDHEELDGAEGAGEYRRRYSWSRIDETKVNLYPGHQTIHPDDTPDRVFRSGRSLKLVYAMKSVTQSQNVCPARYGDPVDIFSCNIFFHRT